MKTMSMVFFNSIMFGLDFSAVLMSSGVTLNLIIAC